jgi:predicted ATPase
MPPKPSPPFLKAIARKPGLAPRADFPWSLPPIGRLESLEFRSPATFFVGENGSGKSTLLECLAAGMGAVAAGSRDIDRDETLRPARELADSFRFSRVRHARARMFLRAEDVFGFTTRVADGMEELRAIEAELDRTLPDGLGKKIALGATRGQRRALSSRYGQDPHGRSHGETFLQVLQERLAPEGLYFLDEPEAPLSPVRVLALLTLLRERVGQGCQFFVATHSPILMALPGAEILTIEGDAIRSVPWDEVEHVQVTRSFLADPDRYLRHLD